LDSSRLFALRLALNFSWLDFIRGSLNLFNRFRVDFFHVHFGFGLLLVSLTLGADQRLRCYTKGRLNDKMQEISFLMNNRESLLILWELARWHTLSQRTFFIQPVICQNIGALLTC
jgi:hypothetical protein